MIHMLFALAATLAFHAGQPASDRYAAGQVWEYRTRPGEEASLLKIQQVETLPAERASETVYHVSVIGVRFRNPKLGDVLAHTPVSRQTLDASVVRRVESTAVFPDPTDGIGMWRDAEGGVFTLTVAEIVDIIDQQTAGAPAA